MNKCSDCWDSPCICGKGYKHLKKGDVIDLVVNILKSRDKSILKQVMKEMEWVQD